LPCMRHETEGAVGTDPATPFLYQKNLDRQNVSFIQIIMSLLKLYLKEDAGCLRI